MSFFYDAIFGHGGERRQERRGECECGFFLEDSDRRVYIQMDYALLDADGVWIENILEFVDGGGVNEYAVTTKSMQQLR